MPLVVLAGHPCSGKSRIAQQLAELFRQRGTEVVIVDEQSLHLNRNQSYKDVPSEKNTRGLLKATLDRTLTKRRMVLFDSLNAIKGYRYEVFCIARTGATRYCMIHVDTPVETCREWNQARPEGQRYSEEIFDDLAGRFERPDSRNKWEAPLFTLRPTLGEGHVQAALQEIVAAMDSGTSGKQGGAAAAAASDGQAVFEPQAVRELKPNLATYTTTAALKATNLQYEIDRSAQAVIERIAEAQAAAGSAPPGVVTFRPAGSSSTAGSSNGGTTADSRSIGEGSAEGTPVVLQLDVSRPMLLPELRRHKRAFMKLTTNQTWIHLADAVAAQRLFVDYLRQQLHQQS